MLRKKFNTIFFYFFIIGTILSSCRNNTTLFESLPASKTNITFANNLETSKTLNILYYLYYYNGGGVSVGDINNDGLPDIYFTANSKGKNKLYLNKGNMVFDDITDAAGVAGSADWCSGVTMADVNNDGYLDIYVSTISGKYNLKGHNLLFINNRNNTFTEAAAKYGLNTSCATTQSAFFDYDNDGDLDCYILNQSQQPHSNIVDTSNRKRYDSLAGDRLYRNDIATTGKFTDVSAAAGIYQSSLGYGLGIAVADINNDGWTDIYVGNDFHENDYYYVNNGNGTFTESGAKHFKHYSRFSMGNDVADYNNDGQLDVVTVDMLPPDEKTLKTYGSDENADIYKLKLTANGYQNQYSRNCLQQNNGNGKSFSDVGLMAGISATDWSWCPLFADFDNDGNKDLFVSSGIVKRPVDLDYIRFVSDLKKKGLDLTDKMDKEAIDAMPDGASHPFMFQGNGKNNFKDVSQLWGTEKMKGYFTGAAYADLDNDGALDIVINSLNANAVVLKNNSANKNILALAFKNDSGNVFGLGTKAYVFSKSNMQYQQLSLTRGFQSSCEAKLYFGLDSAKTADSILIVWPDKKFQLIKNVPVAKLQTISHSNAAGIFDYNTFFKTHEAPLTEVTQNINWKHTENNFLDYNVQYLIPHALSTRGPKIAVADVNGDGLDDFYACGAKGNHGALLMQQPGGVFIKKDSALFSIDKNSEDVDAIFFDADGNKTPDLYIVRGGNEVPQGESDLADRLYLNDGKGNFTLAHNAFQQLYENKSCIAVADIDNDGDNDFFIGNLASPTAYGKPTTSNMFINDGKGNFTRIWDNIIPVTDLGMVTSAKFADFNNDGWQDLMVAGEWMPLTLFINNKGKFTKQALPASSGLWQCIYTTDVNGDGFTDVLAGNWGHNSKLYAGKTAPLKLYVKDFDNNGSTEQIMCYTINGNEYPFLAKDELERPLPVLKKAYLTYSEVAGKTVEYIFFDLFKDYRELKAETLSSACYINNGNGGFIKIDLPDDLQQAPIMAFNESITKNSFIAVGNFYGVIPYEGRYDALLPTAFSFDKINTSFNKLFTLPMLNGEARDIKWIKNEGQNETLVIACNNMKPVFFKINK